MRRCLITGQPEVDGADVISDASAFPLRIIVLIIIRFGDEDIYR